MKNWLPSVPGPAFAVDSTPGSSCTRLGAELAAELVAGAAGAVAERVAALRHEAR